MKRFWHTCLAMIASATMTAGVANAQNDWNAPSEIGSYQSILSRAGYGNGLPATAGRAVGGSGTANVNGGFAGGGSGNANLNGGFVSGGSGNANVNGGFNGGGVTNGGFNGGGVPNGGFANGGFANGGIPSGGSSTRGGSSTNGFVGGGVVDGGMTNGSHPIGNGGGIVTGEVVGGGSAVPYNGSPASGFGQPFNAQPPVAGPVVYGGGASCGGACGGGGGGVADAGFGGPVDSGYGYIDPAYDSSFGSNVALGAAPIFVGGGGGGGQVGRRGRNANLIVGVSALSFARDYEDGVLLSRNDRGDKLFTDDADEGDFGGYGITIGRRKSNGKGFELRYWAFNTDATARLDGASVGTELPTLANLDHLPSARTVKSIFDSALVHVIDRETDINNFEINLLNNGGYYQTRHGRSAHFELVGGLRWFQFDERLAYTAVGDTQAFPLATETLTYQSQVNNDLWGLQLGARNELCFTNRLRGFFGVTAGIFNNHIKTQQNFFDANGVGAVLNDGPSSGREFDGRDSKNDVAILGELDAGITYQVTQRARARFGYRTFGVAGVALAADQIPVDFRRTDAVQTANSNGSLLLQGGYAGMEFCF